MKPRSAIGYALAFLGVLWVLFSLVVYAWLDYHDASEPTHLLIVSILAGTVIGWWGFYWADSKRSLAGGEFVVHSAERLRPVRIGRRESDAVAVVSEPILPIDAQDGDIDNPPHLGAAPEVPHIPEPEHGP